MVTRARKTFQYTEAGPQGLLSDKKAFLVVSSGGTPIGSEYEFASHYAKAILNFIGINDITVIAADNPEKTSEQILAPIEDVIKSSKAA